MSLVENRGDRVNMAMKIMMMSILIYITDMMFVDHSVVKRHMGM
jgi:hypothetical protein